MNPKNLIKTIPKRLTKLPKDLVVVAVVFVAVVILGIILLAHALFPSTAVVKASPVAVIEITSSGFTPSTLQVNVGTKVVWVNYDQSPHQVAADPYPSHSELPALVAPKALGYKQTYSFIFTKNQTIHFYDELNPTWQGTIEVGE